MTRFVVVPGLFTGAGVWQETTERLRAAGATVAVVEVPRAEAGATDLEAHVAEVVAAIDAEGHGAGPASVPGHGAASGSGSGPEYGAASGSGSGPERVTAPGSETGDSPDVVLVGHGYGVYPAVGAADRRPSRVARVVYVDGPLVRDGAVALESVPGPDLREAAAKGELLAAPGRQEWARWGSTAGLSEAHLDRLTALAVPHPTAVLHQPIKLTGAFASVPTTGVLCAASGTTIETLRMVLGFGDPALRALAHPSVTFFELSTGHWPMLSHPGTLADALLGAAAGDGVSLAAEDGAGQPETPGHLRPFLLEVPEITPVRDENIDFHFPPDLSDGTAPRPAVVVIHGGPVPAEARPTPREWPTLMGYARLAAAHGAVGVTLDHRLHALTDYPRACADVAAAVERVRADPRVDETRIALWFFSGSGPMTTPWLSSPPPWLRCLAANYPVMAPLPNWGLSAGPRPADAVAEAGSLPLLLLRAGLESPAIASTVEDFITTARSTEANLTVIDLPDAHHAFEGLDRTDESRRAVRRAMTLVLGHLGLA
ncbi:alpha/beta hydrolase [Streptomyces sp. KLOTTS4A1]|uniref:alpha/beta hydrolase n=1 Tax=Streptomyces sp. KLOTTS4A1 TaxID=3390996 RepID=UPI0039F512F3